MSGYGTKKAGSDEGIFLTYPQGWQDAWTSQGCPTGYFPSEEGGGFDLMVGRDDEQSRYHEAKRMEADMSVMNGIQAKRTADQKLLTGPHNYHLPKPVLSQRRYANPSLGAVGFDSSRQDNTYDAPFKMIENSMAGGGMRGGVRTNEGNAYYRGQLQNRIGQLDRMNAVAQGFAVPMGQNVETAGEMDGTFSKVQFYIVFQSLIQDILAGNFGDFKTDKNLAETIDYLLKYVPTITDPSELVDIIQALGQVLDPIRQVITDDDYLEELKARNIDPRKLSLIEDLFDKLHTYCSAMGTPDVFSLPEIQKSFVSKSFIKELGLRSIQTNLFKGQNVFRREGIANDDGTIRTGTTDDYYRRYEGGEFDDNDGFNRPAATREDSETGFAPRAPLAGNNADPTREQFGRRGPRPNAGASYFGEAEVGVDGAPALVAPLSMAGFDPAAQRPPVADLSAVAESLETVVKDTLAPFKTDADKDASVDELVAKYYPQKHVFIAEVEKAMEERGFTKAQIAAAMERVDDAVYTEYIAENRGETGPAPAEPARRFNPLAGAPPPIFEGAQPAAPEAGTVAERLYATGFPRSREELRRIVNEGVGITKPMKFQRVVELGSLIPPEVGGPYVPRIGTEITNAITAIIAKVRRIDPNF